MSEGNKNLISVIIPAYNIESTIKTTLESIFNQTYRNYEVVVAYDEKTTDNTYSVIIDTVSTHINERVIINVGLDTSLSDARNRGMRYSHGEFICFVDGDDWLHPEYLETLYDLFLAEPTLDVAYCDYHTVLFKENIEQAKASIGDDKYTNDYLSKSQCLQLFSIGPPAPWTAWIYLIRKSYLEKYNISFPEDIRYFEDQVWAANVLSNSYQIGRTSRKLYLYIQRPSSIVHSININSIETHMRNALDRIHPLLHAVDSKLASNYTKSLIYAVAIVYARQVRYIDWKKYLVAHNIKRVPRYSDNANVPFLHKSGKFLFNYNKWLCYIALRSLDNLPVEGVIANLVKRLFNIVKAIIH